MADGGKNLSYQEAAQQLGLTVDQLRDLRADGRIRDHADYGNWTFKVEDVEALKVELEAEAEEAAETPAAEPQADEQPPEDDRHGPGQTKSYSSSKYEPGASSSKFSSSKYQSDSYTTPKYESPKYETPKYDSPSYVASDYEPAASDTDETPEAQPTEQPTEQPETTGSSFGVGLHDETSSSSTAQPDNQPAESATAKPVEEEDLLQTFAVSTEDPSIDESKPAQTNDKPSRAAHKSKSKSRSRVKGSRRPSRAERKRRQEEARTGQSASKSDPAQQAKTVAIWIGVFAFLFFSCVCAAIFSSL